MKQVVKDFKPNSLEDISSILALYRPGPMENIPQYCDVKNGRADRELMHPSIDHLLEETQGIIVYQEQIMKIAQVISGYSLGEADLLRLSLIHI